MKRPLKDSLWVTSRMLRLAWAVRGKTVIHLCSVPRSASTLIFELCLAGFKRKYGDAKVVGGWVTDQKLCEALQDVDIVLVKSHEFHPILRAISSKIIFSYRDVRSAGVSWNRKFNFEITEDLLSGWIKLHRLVYPRADISLRFEDFQGQVEEIPHLLSKSLGISLGKSDLDRINSLREEGVKNSLFHGNHITSTGSMDWKSADNPAYESITRKYSRWFSEQGYPGIPNCVSW